MISPKGLRSRLRAQNSVGQTTEIDLEAVHLFVRNCALLDNMLSGTTRVEFSSRAVKENMPLVDRLIEDQLVYLNVEYNNKTPSEILQQRMVCRISKI